MTLKRISLAESVRLEFGAQASNVFNHPNYAPPGDLTLGVPAFGQITALQSAEGAGPRALQLTARLTFYLILDRRPWRICDDSKTT